MPIIKVLTADGSLIDEIDHEFNLAHLTDASTIDSERYMLGMLMGVLKIARDHDARGNGDLGHPFCMLCRSQRTPA